MHSGQVWRKSLAVVAFSILPLAACSPQGGGGSHPVERSHVRGLAMMYTRATMELGRNPADEAELKGKIASWDPKLDIFDVSSADELFTSERDGKPITVVYGKPPKGLATSVVAYEQEGVDGVRLIGMKRGEIVEADAAKFAQMVPAAAAK